ncbi:MAG: thymidine phosphorylase, partial [Acidimicrobiia bacterium]|nr:thymidine phosphorylase [Acidimicrobiia bacterium]
MSNRHHSMNELIQRKRDKGTLTGDELKWIIAGYTDNTIPDYQMSAFLMAVFLNGFADLELGPWTEAMLHSGDVLDFSHVARPKVDKHSTGGVGDKISIPLAPMAAACGVAVPMMSGRGLGHTGGTLDKLESIPGFRVELDPSEFTSILDRLGIVLAGQSMTLVPADRRIYALRDATGTVESIPLISSSIMSKKMAEDLDGLVLDVKVGSGAFMKDVERARELARTMVGIGAAHGTRVSAILTDMDQPLGLEIGNANEIQESIDVLRGAGPADVVELTYLLGVEMLMLGGITNDAGDARERLETAVDDGTALEVFAAVIAAQGGDPAVIEDRSILARAPLRHEVRAPRAGVVARCDALEIGIASVRLGGGRERKEDIVDAGVGITLAAKRG